MRAEEMFKNYRKMREEREMLSERMKHFSAAPVRDADTEKNPVAQNEQKIIAMENADYFAFMARRYRKIDAELTFFEDSVRMLGEEKSTIIFELLDGDLTWDEISDTYHIGRSTLFNYRRQAIEAINRQYEFVDRLDREYLLS